MQETNVGIRDAYQGKVALTRPASWSTLLFEEWKGERFSKMIMIGRTFLNDCLAICRAVKRPEEDEELMAAGKALLEPLRTE